MRLPQRLLPALLAAQLAATAQAGVNAIKPVQTPQSVVPNVVVNDLLIDFTGDLRGQQLVIRLTAGSIFDAALGGLEPPHAALIPVAPDVQYDSFVAMGGLTQQTSHPLIVAPGTVIDPFCDSFTCAFNATWAPGTGVVIPSGSDFVIGRFTLSKDAQGTAKYFGSTAAGTGDPLAATGTIRNGVISFVPEPTTLGLVGLAASAMCWNYRKRFTKREIV